MFCCCVRRVRRQGFRTKSGDRRPADATRTSEGLLVATVYYLDEPEDAEFLGTSNGH
jgi:hypothetical protein